MKTSRFPRKFVLFSVALAAAVVVPVIARQTSVFNQLDLLVDVRHQIANAYVEEPDQDKMIHEAVRGMVESLRDPYTVYIPPDELKDFDKSIRGSFSGIGAEVDIHNNRLRIVSPLEESPAWKAGVMAGDTVLEIDGKSTLDMKITDAISRLTGVEGTPVKLKIRHESGDETELTIKRARINVATVRGLRRDGEGKWDFMLDEANHIGYIRITQFTEGTARDTRAALDSLLARGVKGLILDLRFDPGGLLESAVEISDMFLDGGKRIVSVKGRIVPEHVESSTQEGTIPPIPMVVIANEASASASEVVTGALSDNGRAQFVGTRTFGKGSVQQVVMLDDGQGALKITNAYYYLPNGRNIHRREGKETWGVDPSEGCYVPMSNDAIRKMLEIRREGDVLRKMAGDKAHETVTPVWLREKLVDPQLAAGLEAVLGKIKTGTWPKVGQTNADLLAHQSRHDNLTRQRELLAARLGEVEKELNKLDGNGSHAATAPTTAPAAGAITTQPIQEEKTEPDMDDEP
ncbi:MAG: S41 family peptidase [Planctomycetes bacterium]|nr:S41 family peptidase [Planctomycetota bacterium]